LQNPNIQSSVTAIVVAAIELFPLILDPHHCMGKNKSSSKSKEVLVDEEASLSIIENQDFVAMRASEKIWPSSSMMEDQLQELLVMA
jgi:predicted ATP-grasp superfamily ATP-dependent carboligase